MNVAVTAVPTSRPSQAASRVAFEDMAPLNGLRARLSAPLSRVQNRLSQMLFRHQCGRIVEAMEAGPEATAALAVRLRLAHDRFDRPFAAALEAEAVREHRPLTAADQAGPRADWFKPRKGQSRGVVMHVHGGSFVAAASPRISDLIARLSAAAGARVFAPDYRLAPEHPCPCAVDDICEAWRWLVRTHPDEPLAAAADSAGAAILLAALQRLRDEGAPMPRGVVLLSPWVDLALTGWSVLAATLTSSSPYGMDTLALFVRLYLQGRSPFDPVASPLYGDFAGLPPMLIHASRADIVHDDAVRLADKMREAGGDLTVRLWPGQTHVWERMRTPEARRSLEAAADFLRDRLSDRRPH